MVRKVGGFTFQELNLTIDDIKNTSERGADLSYDFINRPAYHHALATGDTEFLRLTLQPRPRRRRRAGLAGARPAEPRRDDLRAGALRDPARRTTRSPSAARRSRAASSPSRSAASCVDRLTGDARALQRDLHDQNGIASTTAHDHRRRARLHRPRQADRRRRSSRSSSAHLLLAMFNACSRASSRCPAGTSCGAAHPRPQAGRPSCSRDGDTRWIHRSAYDLMDYRPDATESTSKMPRGDQPVRLAAGPARGRRVVRPPAARRSCAVRKRVRDRHRRPSSTCPQVSNKAMLVMVHQLERGRPGHGAQLLRPAGRRAP